MTRRIHNIQDAIPWKSLAAQRHYYKYRDDPEWKERYNTSTKKYWNKNRLKYRKANRENKLLFLFSYQAQVGCLRCRETNPIVLQFHHRPGTVKEFTLGTTSSRERCFDKILKELEKCNVLCANCHRLEHWDLMHQE